MWELCTGKSGGGDHPQGPACGALGLRTGPAHPQPVTLSVAAAGTLRSPGDRWPLFVDGKVASQLLPPAVGTASAEGTEQPGKQVSERRVAFQLGCGCPGRAGLQQGVRVGSSAKPWQWLCESNHCVVAAYQESQSRLQGRDRTAAVRRRAESFDSMIIRNTKQNLLLTEVAPAQGAKNLRRAFGPHDEELKQ